MTAVRVALTFDAEHPDHPATDPIQNAERLLDLLGQREISATFFIQSSWANAYRHLAERIKGDGHLIGSHSHWHCLFPGMASDGIANDLARSRRILDAIAPTGHWFRLPGGSGHDDRRVLKAVRGAGYRHVGWTCGGNDWEPDRTVDEVAVPIIEHVRSAEEPVAVALLHSWPDPTTGAVATILDQLGPDIEYVRLDQVELEELPRHNP